MSVFSSAKSQMSVLELKLCSFRRTAA